MKIRTILDGNAFYEIDEDCLAKREAEQKKKRIHSIGQGDGIVGSGKKQNSSVTRCVKKEK